MYQCMFVLRYVFENSKTGECLHKYILIKSRMIKLGQVNGIVFKHIRIKPFQYNSVSFFSKNTVLTSLF